MSKGVARMTDIAIGFCAFDEVPWIGMIVTGSPDVICNNLPVARLTDLVIGCHIGIIMSASESVIVNNLGVARIGDIVIGGCVIGIIITGSNDTISG